MTKIFARFMVIVVMLFVTSVYAKDVTLGIVPQQSPLKLSKKWLQITQYLSKETGLNVLFKTENSISAFEKKLYAGVYDFAYMNPYHFVLANEAKGYVAKIRANKLIKGIIVSKKKTLEKEDLEKSRFLFPAPKAFAATLLTKYELKNKFGFDIEKDKNYMYVNSHDSVYKGISRGIGEFGGGIVRTFNNFNESKDKDKLHVVYSTNGYPSHPIAFHPNKVTQIEQEKLVKAFLNMPKDLLKILSIKKFINTDTQEYDVIKQFK
jgi:phosphonate transport system substrate-binding protein